jgi:hypothetical protein
VCVCVCVCVDTVVNGNFKHELEFLIQQKCFIRLFIFIERVKKTVITPTFH